MNAVKRLALMVAFAGFAIASFAQGVTTGNVSGIVTDGAGVGMPGATVLAVHEPSGTRYGTSTLVDGRFTIPGMRVGGPYTLTASFVGYESQSIQEIYVILGGTADVDFTLHDAAQLLEEVLVIGVRDAVFSSNRTGASTSITRDAIASLPTISRRIGDFTRLTPQASGNSFAGQDNRINNITVDGSYFNNSFGLAGQPGDRTGVAPISMDAIEQISVNIAPYDVRQGNFVGAGVNTVTRSGTNQFQGSAYYNFRSETGVGRQAGDITFTPGAFKFDQIGLSFGGPIIKNRLFFFASFEQEDLVEPGTTFLANTGGQPVGGNITRVLASDLDALSTFLRTNFNYETGPYQGYDHETPARRFIVKLDYNINDRNKLSIRYNHLDSDADIILSNSSALGWGARRTNLTGLNFQNSNYKIRENIRSIVGELNSKIGENMANSLILGYTFHDESRDSRGTMFPMVDILDAGTVYTTFGFEPFTPNNELRYGSYQFQNNFTIFLSNHTLTFGASAELYESENIFFPGSQSVYVYNSLANFYTDANGFIADPARTVSPVNLRRFQVRWSNIPGQDKPVQPLQVFYAGVYGQNEWQVNSRLRVTAGLRLDVPFFGDTGYKNADVDAMNFIDENGNTVKYSTDKLPDPDILWSPRLGFNWDATGDRSTQFRGGTGIFTGRPAYVWISNQIGNNGILTGFESLENTTARPFHTDINRYKPATVTGAPAASYELAFTDPDFKFPQIWRTNFAIDQKLPWGLVGTAEFIYSRDINMVYYINANLMETTATLAGPDNRPLYSASPANRINPNIVNAIVLKNQNVGYAYNISATLQKPFTNGFFAKVGYNYGIAKNTVDPASIAFTSWIGNPHTGDPNNPGLSYSGNSAGHRAFGALSFRTRGGTTYSLFYEGRTIGNASYTYAGDLNRDGGTANDLIYVPKDVTEMNFFQFVVGTRTFTVAEQQAAWAAFVQQDKYLRTRRGDYAERGAAFMPMVHRVDIAISQDFSVMVGGQKNTLQLRFDILNFGNMLNEEWGLSQRFETTQPLILRPTALGGPLDATGRPIYRLANIGTDLISKSFSKTASIGDVYRIQFGVRYIFN